MGAGQPLPARDPRSIGHRFKRTRRMRPGRRLRTWAATVCGRLGSLAQAGRAQRQRDAIDGYAPVGGAFGGKAEGATRLGGVAAVAEDAGAGLARIADRLLPLDGIDVMGGHGWPLPL